MVLESLVSAITAEMHPKKMLLLGFFYASIGVFLSLWIFKEHASLIMVFLTTMATIPIVYNIIKAEEKKDLIINQEKFLLREHERALKVFIFYFIGATLGFAFWYTILPSETISTLFQIQTDTIISIRSNATGNTINRLGFFSQILSNNLKVLIFCILFSFIYGSGAVFILTWNASVIGTAVGDTIRAGISALNSEFHFGLAHSYVGIITYGLFRYAIHGIPEILAYFTAGLAGGIISIAAIRHDFGTKKYEMIIMDSSLLLIVSIILLVVAAFLEVYITPLIM